jgi:hypothetical protein
VKLKSVILISFGTRGGPEGRQTAFWADASGRFGGGYRGAYAGKTQDDAVAFAFREMIRYGFRRPGSAICIGDAAITSRVAAALNSQ